MIDSESKTAGLESLFAAIREACATKLWSRGIELNRRSSVCREDGDEERIVLRLSEQGQTIARVVSFWLEEGDWHCDCGDKEDPCIHIIASVIHLKQAHDKGEQIPIISQAQYRVVYRFTRKAGFLYFDRMILSEGGKSFRLTSSLMALATGRVQGPKITPTKEDVAVDLLLKDFQSGLVPPHFMHKLLAELVSCRDITLDGAVVRCGRDRTGFIACLEDAPGGGIRLFGLQDPAVKETFRNGAALCEEGVLKPFGHGKLQPEEIKMLAEGRYFPPREFPELVSELLPALEQKLAVQIRAKHLPQQVRVAPRLIISANRSAEALFVSPSIVYGDPVIAKVIHGDLELMGTEIPIRDEKEEKRLQSVLQRDFTSINLDEVAKLIGEEAVLFVENLSKWNSGDILGDGLEAFRKHSILKPELSLDCKTDSVTFDMSFKTAQGGTVSASSVVNAWKQGQQLVALLEGGYAPLPKEWMERYGDILRDLLLARSNAPETHPCMLGDLSELCEGVQYQVPESFLALKKRFEDISQIPEVALPDDLQATLREYQKEGVGWLRFLQGQGFGALLADDMGLGKTLQAICILSKPSLVVAPTSVIYNWEREINRFRPNLNVCVYHGLRRTLVEDADVVLTTYALLRQDEDKLANRIWKVAVLDEAQNIKNPDSQVAKAAFTLQSEFRLTLTGTPIENSLEDVWSQFHFLNRAVLGSRKTFLENFSKPILQGDEQAITRLKRRLKPFILRRMKSEVAAELPPRSDLILYCELNEDERLVYDSLLNSSRSDVLKKLNQGESLFQILEVLLRLRQASCHLGLIPGQIAETSSKIERLISCLKESVSEGHKALIFSQWTSLLDLIELVLKREGLAFDRIDGSTRDRGAVVDRFQADKDLPVLLLSLKAAGTGLNLTAADHVFIVDPWWNPAIEEQAADRAYRIGQTKPVMVYRLVAKDTVEERILLLKEKKRALASAVVEVSGENFKITRDDLLSLFEGGEV